MTTVALFLLGFAPVLMLLGKLVDDGRGVRLRPGWMCGVVGLRGGGKSLYAGRLIAARLRRGINVVANFNVPGCELMQSWDDLILSPPGTFVILDEAHQWARATGRTPDPLADWYISHARKLGHEVYWLAQHESQIATFVKSQTNEMILCEKMVGRLHRASAYAPHDFRKKDSRSLWRWWYTPRGAALAVFDTRELIRPVDLEKRTKAESDAHLNSLIDRIEARAQADGRRARDEPPADALTLSDPDEHPRLVSSDR